MNAVLARFGRLVWERGFASFPTAGLGLVEAITVNYLMEHRALSRRVLANVENYTQKLRDFSDKWVSGENDPPHELGVV